MLHVWKLKFTSLCARKLVTQQKFIPETQLLCELSEPFLCTQVSFSFDSQGWAQF